MTFEPSVESGEVNMKARAGPSARFRWRLSTVMFAVLVVGVALGLAARWYRQRIEREASLAEMMLQNSVTDTELSLAQSALAASRVSQAGFATTARGGSVSGWTSSRRSITSWITSLGLSYSQPGSGTVGLKFEVSGGLRGTNLEPITIEVTGPEALGKPVVDRLKRAYDAKGWRYRVIRKHDESPKGQ
jgi:hypothetical protein